MRRIKGLASHTFPWAVFCGMVFLNACNEPQVPNPSGFFVGEGMERGKAVQIVAQLPGVQKNQIKFKVYPVLATATPRNFSIEWVEETQKSPKIRVMTDLLSSSAEAMSSASSRSFLLEAEPQGAGWCAHPGKDAAFQNGFCSVRLCLSDKKIEFEVKDCSTGQIQASFSLEKNATLGTPPGKAGDERLFELDEVLGRVKFFNFNVQKEAERVFQARESVKIALANLLPHIRTRDALAFGLGDASGMVETIGSLLPFIFPANWFQWEKEKYLMQAERKSFASLRGNEMQATESLYYLLQRDEAVLRVMSSHIDWLERLEQNIAAEEGIGLLPRGSAEYFGMTVLSMKSDQQQVIRLVELERAALSQAMALSPLKGITGVAPFQDQDISHVQAIDPVALSQQAKAKSLEVEILDSLSLASQESTKATVYGFISPESDLSLGFGTPRQIQLGKSELREIAKKKEETLSLLEQRSMEIQAEQHSAIRSYLLAKESLQRAKNRLSWLMKRHLSGDVSLSDEDFLAQLRDLQEKILLLQANQLSSGIEYNLMRSKQSRLLRSGFYEDLEAALPESE